MAAKQALPNECDRIGLLADGWKEPGPRPAARSPGPPPQDGELERLREDLEEARTALAWSQARCRMLAEQTPMMMHSIDRNGRICSVSDLWLTTLGYRREEVIGRHSIEFLTETSRRYAIETVLPEYMRTGFCSDVHYEFVKQSGEVIDILLSATAERDAKDEVLRSIAVLVDVTERKRAEDALRTAKDQAEAASRTKSEFLASMSHELRTPLNAILGFSEIMRAEMFGPLGSPRYLAYANDIYQSGGLLLELINDILDLSKIEAGRLELHEENLDIGDLIDGALLFTRDRATGNGIALDCDLQAGLPPLRADRRLFTQILLNLLSNAIKFTPRDGRITVTARIDGGGEPVIEVSDTGIGIAPADIAKVMEAFGQVESTMSRKHGGTGLGLPLSKGMAELHGGRLEIRSELGRGTVVGIHMPADRLVRPSRDEPKATREKWSE